MLCELSQVHGWREPHSLLNAVQFVIRTKDTQESHTGVIKTAVIQLAWSKFQSR